MLNSSLRLLTVFCLLVAVVCSGCIPTKPTIGTELPGWIKGTWEGIGYQINLPQTWAIDLEVDLKTATINYPSLECSGMWEIANQSIDRVEFREVILKGADRCVNGGLIVITRVDQHHISYSFFEPQNGKLEAHSTLVNVEYERSKKI